MQTLPSRQRGMVDVGKPVSLHDVAAVQSAVAADVRLFVVLAHGAKSLPPGQGIFDSSQRFLQGRTQDQFVGPDRGDGFVLQDGLQVIVQASLP